MRGPDGEHDITLAGAPDAGVRLPKVKLHDALEALTLAALVVYGAVHFADYAFYARLGVSPEDVGLDYARTLAKVAIGFVLLAATVALLLTAGAQLAAKDDHGRMRGLLGWLGGMLALGMGSVLLLTLLPPVPRLLVFAVSGGIIVLGAYLDEARRVRLLRWAWTLDLSRKLMLGATGLVLIFGLAGVGGYHAAGYVRAGETPPCGCTKLFGHNVALPWLSGSRGFMGVQAERAEVAWVNPANHPAHALPTDALYLGSADEMVALYDVARAMTVRIPAQSVTVATEPAAITWRESSGY
jgi:hypothetical protein